MQSRKPTYMIPENEELTKAQILATNSSGDNHVNFKATETVPNAPIAPQYRAPYNRENGNQVFRRYPDGSLDLEHCTAVILEVLNRVKNSRGQEPLTSQDHAILGCVFPPVFAHHVDHGLIASIRSVTLRVSETECAMLAIKVAENIAEISNFNGGYGGNGGPNDTRG